MFYLCYTALLFIIVYYQIIFVIIIITIKKIGKSNYSYYYHQKISVIIVETVILFVLFTFIQYRFKYSYVFMFIIIFIITIIIIVVLLLRSPSGAPDKPLRVLLFDNWYDKFRGVVCLVKVVDGTLKKGDKVTSAHSQQKYDVMDVGILYPDPVTTNVL